ncbi:MAG: hypothetical protein P8I78_06305 [Flavobacterium sp.]|nr:hypothetical protein [Flavobacterium sp.]
MIQEIIAFIILALAVGFLAKNTSLKRKSQLTVALVTIVAATKIVLQETQSRLNLLCVFL